MLKKRSPLRPVAAPPQVAARVPAALPVGWVPVPARVAISVQLLAQIQPGLLLWAAAFRPRPVSLYLPLQVQELKLAQRVLAWVALLPAR